jgi:hypothetical protein
MKKKIKCTFLMEKLQFLVIIVASKSPIYNKMKKLYVNFIKNLKIENINFVFIYNGNKSIKINENCKERCKIEKSPNVKEILLDMPETVENIVYKTLYLINKYKDQSYFDYLIKTNLSTVLDFNKLIIFISLINNQYKSINEYIIIGTNEYTEDDYKKTILSSKNLIMSRKVVEKIETRIDFNLWPGGSEIESIEHWSIEDLILSNIIFKICHNTVIINIPRIDFINSVEKETILWVPPRISEIESANYKDITDIFCYRFHTKNRENDILRMSFYMQNIIKESKQTSKIFHSESLFHLIIKTPRVFIYGNTGYIGSNLINYLEYEFDIIENIEAITESDYLIYAVHDWKNTKNNLDLIFNLIEKLKFLNVTPTIIYISSGVVNCEENKNTEYYKIKTGCEKLFQDLYSKIIILRLGSVWGGKMTNNLRFINKMFNDIRRKNYIEVSNRDSSRYILHILDLSKVVMSLINDKVENGIYEYYTEKLKMYEIINCIVNKFKKTKVYYLKKSFDFKIKLNVDDFDILQSPILLENYVKHYVNLKYLF